MLTRYWQAVVRRLDRPGRGRRVLLAAPAAVWVSATYREPCFVYWRNGSWIHHYRGARIPHASLGRAAPPSVLTAEARELFLHDYTPRRGDTVFDVGAGIGAGALLFSGLVGETGRVVSLEAHPRTYERLADLCEANRLDNVTPLHMAASDTDGSILISDADHYLQNTVLGPGNGGIEVPARRIDTIAADRGITRIDLLAMNIEGAERLAIAGLDGIIDTIRHVCISCHDFLADDGGSDDLRTKAMVRQYLVTHGFRVLSRDDAEHPWTRDYLYGSKTQ